MIARKTLIVSLITFLFISLTSYAYIITEDKVPEGWFKTGSSPQSYVIGIEKKAGENGGNAVYIKSTAENIKGFGTLMQYFSAEKYLNKRVRLSGYIKSKDVAESAGLWMRIDGKDNPSKPLSFDNMANRPIKGTTEWKKYDIVLDVPSNSNLINFGLLLSGTGEVWISELKYEVVDKDVPTTNLMNNAPKADEPVNLNFEK